VTHIFDLNIRKYDIFGVRIWREKKKKRETKRMSLVFEEKECQYKLGSQAFSFVIIQSKYSKKFHWIK
jgi:hypothetical protein